MCKRALFTLGVCILVGLAIQAFGQQKSSGAKPTASELSDREKDGLIGPVRRVKVESAKIILKNGTATESSKVLREVTTYDARGKKVDSVAYPVDGETLAGKEQYKYDDKGNIVEMQLRGENGRLLSKEVYKYQLDEVGNWKKMITSLAIFQDGQPSEEPVEATYRSITYFYGQEIVKLVGSTPGNVSANRPAIPPQTVDIKPAPARQRASSPSTSEPQGKRTIESRNVANLNPPQVSSPPGETQERLSVQPSPVGGDTFPVSQNLSTADRTVSQSNPQLAIPTDTTIEDTRKQSDTEASGETVGNAAATGALLPNPAPPSRSLPASDANALYNLGLAYLNTGKTDQAVQVLKQAVHKDPENALAYVKLGLGYAGLRQYPEAIAVFKMAIQIRRDLVDAEGYYQLGQAYMATENFSDAVTALKQALYLKKSNEINGPGLMFQASPTAAEIHYSLGIAYFQVNKYSDAVKELKRVIEINPNLAEGHFGLGLCYFARGDRKAAQKHQKILRGLNPELARKLADALTTQGALPPGVTHGILGRRRMD